MPALAPMGVPPHRGTAQRHIAIFAATVWEFRAAQSAMTARRIERARDPRVMTGGHGAWRVVLIKTGIGPACARRAAHYACSLWQYDAMLSTGFACALEDARIGDVLIGTEIAHALQPSITLPQDEPLTCARELTTAAWKAGLDCGIPVTQGVFVSTDRVLCTAGEKQALATRSGAIGVDMESMVLAQMAAHSGVPFGIVRTVSDRRDEDLPIDFNHTLAPQGWSRVLLGCMLRPPALRGLVRLYGQARVAATNLSRVLMRTIDHLS